MERMRPNDELSRLGVWENQKRKNNTQYVRNATMADNTRSLIPEYIGSILELADLVVVGPAAVVVAALLGIDEAE